jgi:hypothetical protein
VNHGSHLFQPAIREHRPNLVPNGEKRVDIRALKALVFGRFPKNTAIYEVMLTEKDSLGVFELMVKVDVWLKLLRSVSY